MLGQSERYPRIVFVIFILVFSTRRLVSRSIGASLIDVSVVQAAEVVTGQAGQPQSSAVMDGAWRQHALSRRPCADTATGSQGSSW
jgi:hypothetical protein